MQEERDKKKGARGGCCRPVSSAALRAAQLPRIPTAFRTRCCNSGYWCFSGSLNFFQILLLIDGSTFWSDFNLMHRQNQAFVASGCHENSKGFQRSIFIFI
ncbi:uncharacterized protein LOC128672679 [Plodia interpunctella]|uniref:uncharacterized protein LOC128672679 n=1 Tax=Plodia interpunctella TaxID=58824 RepID=UPI002367B775|nr:uncharacterized protein LOC128672679 [Plodia interpunctella]